MRPLLTRSLGLALVLACGCGAPFIAKDGTVAFPEKGAHGASIVTANGVEFHDRADVPKRIVSRDPNDPWRPPVGFILPRSGRFHATSSPTVVVTQGLRIFLRPSDTRVPSWGGEVLVRIDVVALANAPAAGQTARPPEHVAIVLDGEGPETTPMAEAALGQLSAQDRVVVLDARGDRVVVPMMPASHRSLVLGAITRRMDGEAKRGPDALGPALAKAGELAGDGGRIVLLSDGDAKRAYAPDVQATLQDLAAHHVHLSAFGTTAHTPGDVLSALAAYGGGGFDASEAVDARQAALRADIPGTGASAFRDVVLTFAGTPAPSHVLEASGGDVIWRLDAGELMLGNVRAGEARTEVVRVTVPAWVPGERFKFTVTARADDVALGQPREFSAELPCVYDDDIERIAESRHGDVIAYASALATLSRLDAAFLGESHSPNLQKLARMHARSMALLGRDMHDPALAEQAAIIDALLTTMDGP